MNIHNLKATATMAGHKLKPGLMETIDTAESQQQRVTLVKSIRRDAETWWHIWQEFLPARLRKEVTPRKWVTSHEVELALPFDRWCASVGDIEGLD